MDDLRLRCVSLSSEKEVHDVLKQAFKVMSEQSFDPVWFTQDECLQVSQKERNTIYIFDLFEGEAFDHIAGLGCRILGPMSILTSVALKQNIPRTSRPLYNMAMKDIVVCCTNLEKETRERLLKLVEFMGGSAMKDFTEDVTHLIAGVSGSKKYQVAAELGKQLMLPKWVEVIWEKAKFEAVHGMDEQFQEYKCPVFVGCVVTVSGIGTEERKEVKKLVEREGGQYSGEMRVKETTHLILNEPKGQKYQFALKWGLKIVRSDWLYDSIEKGYCQDESKYEVKSDKKGEMKTSTPERKSMAGGINDLSNISAISMHHIEESRMANLTTTRLEEPDPLDALDMSKMPGEMFLDGCKVYLSGFRGTTLDKLRKIINIGGATRYNQITDNVTHIVIGERINSDVEQIKTLVTRPHTVTANWLVECYKQETHLEESSFYSSELPAPEPASPQLRKSVRKSHIPREVTGTPKVAPPPATSVETREGANEDDMHEIMSQYLTNPNADTNQTNNTTVAPQNAEEFDDDLTQDPDAATGTQMEGGVFSGKSFMLFGFEEEHMPVLTSFIKENGGKVLQLNARTIPDYAVVPIDGFPVDKTVNSIVTNVWLQMCIEQNQLLPEQSNALFMPLEIQMDKTPLSDCVLSVSGYIGVERDCLMHIAGILGARTQEYFVRNAKKGLLPSTHLIVNAPEGSKYEAAVKWGIPAVTKDWLLACAKTGCKENENHYLTVNGDKSESRMVVPSDETDEAENQQNHSKTKSNQSDHSMENENHSNAALVKESEKVQSKDVSDISIKNKSNQNERTRKNSTAAAVNEFQEFSTMGETEALMLQMSSVDQNKQGSSAHTESVAPANDFQEFSEMGDTEAVVQELNNAEHAEDKDVRLGENDVNKTVTDTISCGDEKQVTDTASGTCTDTVRSRQSLGRKQVPDKQSASQKENVSSSGRSTPAQSRIKVLQQEGGALEEKVTPSKFLNPNKRFNPGFNIEELLAEIHTPEHIRTKRSKRKDSLPLEELFSIKLEEASQKIANDLKKQKLQSQSQRDEVDGVNELDITSDILRGVVISVSKKLGKDQSELNDLVSSMGGDYRWNYDSSCTHFIFQGRANDTSKEFRMARNQKNLRIVSPHWLYKCKEQKERVEESLYPHTFNPNLSLSVVSSKRTPLRTPIRSRRLRDRNNSNKVINIDNTEDSNQISSRPTLPDKTDDAGKTHSKGDNQGDSDSSSVERKSGRNQKELRSSDKSESEEEKRVPDPNAEVGSLEMREVLSKQLEHVMAEPLEKKKRKSKRLNSSGQVSTPEDLSRQARRTQEDNLKNSSGRTSRGATDTSGRASRGASGKSEEKFSGDIPQSQSVQVVWSDPVGRLEQEKLAEKLERACSPTQEVDHPDHKDLEIPENAQYSDTEPEPEPEDPPFSKKVPEPTRITPKVTRQNSDRTPTPEGPPLAFPTAKSEKITPPRPVELIEDQPPPPRRDPPVFILSGMSQAEKDDYGALIEQLGGKLLESQMFDSRCTHLVINNVTRNEKFLASVASGKWVLHKSYFEACRQEKSFVQEDVYEWGSEGTLSLIKNMDSNVRLLAAAARQWRIQIQEEKKTSPDNFGAFCNWNVILCCDKNKEASYRRLLEAGGAKVVSQRPPFSSDIDATHVLLEPHKVPLTQEDFEALLTTGCLCLRPDFISAHLSDPEVNADEYCPAEIVALKAVMTVTPKKRKASSGQAAVKRSRRR